MHSIPGIAIVTRPTRLEGLRRRWGTLGQAKFRMVQAQALEAERRGVGVPLGRGKRRGAAKAQAVATQADFTEYEREDSVYQRVIDGLERDLRAFGIPVKIVDRAFLPNFDFGLCSVVVVVGQDGLVANAAKYVGALPIVAVNPDPARFDGILLPFRTDQARQAVQAVLQQKFRARPVTLAETLLNDGQRLLAFNDFFIGAATHVSARYVLEAGGRSEPQSSSGILVSTGAGSTGWLSSVFNMATGVARFLAGGIAPPPTLAWEERRLAWAVREPFVSRQSQASLVAGWLDEPQELIIESLMPEGGVIFSDGVEADFLPFTSGSIARVRVSEQRANLVVG
jgi:hypothetical protein